MGLKFRRGAMGAGRAVCALACGVSLLASGTLDAARAADAASMLSPAALARTASGAGVNSQPSSQILASPSLQAQRALSAANLARAAADLSAINAAQAAASASSQLTLNNVALSGSSWNGTALSGLNPRDSDPTLWIGADALKKDTASATATVQQTAATALLTWQSFDINKGEKLVFDQQGNADWAVLNRVVAGPRGADGSRFVASPSRILGSIEAPGSVYVINPNGVVFGPTAQVNVHSFIASTLDVGNPSMSIGERNSFFLNSGFLGTPGGDIPAESFSYNPADTKIEGDIMVEAGARITASLAPRAISPDAGGFVYLFAPNVTNRGTISTPAGETLMVAAQAVQLIANGYPDGFATDDQQKAFGTFRAVGINSYIFGGPITNGGTITTRPIIWRTDGLASAQISAPGQVTNSGLISAERGVVILNGDLVTNGSSGGSGPGVIQANTSVTRNGQVFLDARLKLTLNGGSIQILPSENGETIPNSALPNFAPGKVEMSGRIIDIEPGSLIEAPGATVSVTSANRTGGISYPQGVADAVKESDLSRIYMAAGSAIDVSGLQDVQRPMSDNFLTFKPFGNEFADQPLQRNGALRGVELTVDLRQSGTLNGVNWVGTPLANLVGYKNAVQSGIDQLLTNGGNVAMTTVSNGQIVLRQGSSINIGGGSVQYAGDTLSASKLLTADGRVVSISRADPLDTYIGVAGVTQELHPHWGSTTTQTFNTPLLTAAAPEPGYTEGHDAGAINLTADAYVLNGAYYAGVIAGDRQRATGARPSTGDSSTAMPMAGSFQVSGQNNLILSQNVTPLAGAFTVTTPLPDATLKTTTLSAQTLSDAGFGKIAAAFSGSLKVTQDASLVAAPGGAIKLTGGSADIEGSLVARSGSIQVESTANIAGDTVKEGLGTAFVPTTPVRPHDFDLVVGAAARLDVSGLWINDDNASAADLAGNAFIDGGSITLRTDTRSAACETTVCTTLPGLGQAKPSLNPDVPDVPAVPAIVDLTGDIVLNRGALLDVSSGGRITERGIIQLDSAGRAVGKGGNVSLSTYVGVFSGQAVPLPPTVSGLTANIRFPGFDGTAAGNAAALSQVINAYGFSQGGTLALQVPSLDIGAVASTGASGLVLSSGFFGQSGFSNYNLATVGDHLAVTPGTALVLRQRNLVPQSDLTTLPTGARVSQATSVDYLSDFIRQPVSLNLSATAAPIDPGPYDPAKPGPSSKVVLSVGEGASIVSDPGASIGITIAGRAAFQPGSQGAFNSEIFAQIGVAEILGSVSAPGGSIAINGGQNSSVWLGAASQLSANGAAVTDNRQTLFRTGKVLPGGSVAITVTDPASSVLGLAGARIDVSGGRGTFDLLTDNGFTTSGQQRVATVIGSDAGAIAITAPTLLYDGAFAAQPGTDSTNGGSLTIVAPETGAVGAEIITVRQSGGVVPLGRKSTDALGGLAGSVVFFADRLGGSGIQDLTLSMGQTTGDVVRAQQVRFAPGTLAFSGNVTIADLAHLYLDASQITLNNPVTPAASATCTVCLNASYVALRGAGNPNKVVTLPGKGVLQISGGTIDIAVGGFAATNQGDFDPHGASNLFSISGVSRTDFISTGDIRLRVPLANVPLDLKPGALPAGELITAGDLTFTAAQVYTASAVDFTLKSIAPKGAISFMAGAAPQAALLSAGGQLTVSAATINQMGVLRAPLGTIRLGAQTAADLSPSDPLNPLDPLQNPIATSAVNFGAGSVTSVSLSGELVPYGQTANGTSWSYDTNTGQPLTAPPAKKIVTNAASIKLAAGTTLDVTGSGDLQAIEFVPGTGGSRDILASANSYAVIPGFNPSVAPIDLDFALQQKDVQPLAGARVYLSGQGDLPAGYYTLLPAHYATLPGAYRVGLTIGGGTDAVTVRNAILPDGTLRMAGFFYNSDAAARGARQQYFDVQSASTWRQYSEIDSTSANSFFGAKTTGVSGLAPKLPADAGRAVFSALNALDLAGQILFAPAKGGRGGELDIAAQDIQVLSPGKAARSGYVAVDATQLSNLGFDSLLLGGVRDDTTAGQVVTVSANSVELSNDASAPLEGPEIILVTKVGSGALDPNAGRALTLDAGSVLRTKGSVVDPRQKTLIIGSDANKINGNGSLVAVSSGSTLNVQRQRATQTNGNINLLDPDVGVAGPGASITGNSVTFDTTGTIRPGANMALSAANIAVAARSFNFGTTQANMGLNINGNVAAQFAQAINLTLRTARPIQFSGDVGFAMAAPGSHLILNSSGLVSTSGSGAVTLSAGRIDWINSGTASTTPAAGSAILNLNASEIDLGVGSTSLSGFGVANLSASSQIALAGTGSLNAGAADLFFNTPLLLAAAKSNQTLTTTGNFSLAGTGATPPVTQDQVGGILALTARSIALAGNANLQATAGGVTLTATTGDITLGANAKIQATGFVSTFFDTAQVVGGGSVQLNANQGSIDIDSSALIDVSSAAGQPGYAGQIGLVAANGFLRSANGTFNMKTITGTVAGDGGGRLTIDTKSLGTNAISLPGMYDAAIDLRLRQGNIELVSDIRARSVTVTADGGSLTVSHKIDSSGTKGGSISLYGKGVIVTPGATLLATASDATKHGGDIVIGTSGAGVLDMRGGLIDVTNTADASMGGTVRLRAPLTGGAFDDVAINTVNTKVQGASSIAIEGYRVWNAVDPASAGYNPNTNFNGVIDPQNQGGFYGFCNASGVCTGTLIDFVQKFSLSADARKKFASLPAAVLHLQPGIELVNNTGINNIPAVNGGDITVASPWNLGSGVSGFLVSAADYVVNKVVIAPAGTIVTDANGVQLPQYSGYKGDLNFGAGFFANTDPFTSGGKVIAAGTVITDANGNVLSKYAADFKGGRLTFVAASSKIRNLNYRVGGSLTGEPGVLTLRATRDVNINNSITDGFYNTRNVFDTNYQKNLTSWLSSVYQFGDITTDISNVGGYLFAGATANYATRQNGFPAGPIPLAPYDAVANSVSPTFSAQRDKTPLTSADLFALIADPSGAILGSDGKRYSAVNSWSYRIVAGADATSANPLAVQPLAVFDPTVGGSGHGNVIIDGHTQYNVTSTTGNPVNQTYETPTIVRTGTGSIDIAAGLDFILADKTAPGVVYTAGRNSVALPDPGFVVQTVDDPLSPDPTDTVTAPFATNPEGFLTPKPLLCDLTNFNCNPSGPPNLAAYPVNAGDITLTAQRDIIGFEHPTIREGGVQNLPYPAQQYFTPWLLAQSSNLSLTNFGPFSPLSGYLSNGGSVFTPQQTSWWINFGSFDQGVMSVGGDVTVKAGRDIQELSVSLPTTARVSGGLSSTIVDAKGNTVANVPVMHLNPSGDLTVIAGRDLKSGAYYEGSGDATILVGGSVSASWSQLDNPADPTSAVYPVSTVLAVDTGKLNLQARGNVDIAGVVSGLSLQNVADLANSFNRQSLSGYGPNSAVSVFSVGGDIVTNSLESDLVLAYNVSQIAFPVIGGFMGTGRYPASFRAVAANGDVTVGTSFRLTNSQTGSLELLAHGSLKTAASTVAGRGLQPLSTGASLVEQVFDPANPLSGFAPLPGATAFDLGSILLHLNDRTPDTFYAATGDIIANQTASPFPNQSGSDNSDPRRPLAWEITKTAKVQAARDILDLSFFGQNLAPTDITLISAGRDIVYTGTWQKFLGTTDGIPDLGAPQNLGGLSLAGPGFFQVQAGRNLGPFVTAAADVTAGLIGGAKSDPVGTGIVTFGNTVTVGNRRLNSDADPEVANAFATSANSKMPRQGASIVALFGVANGVKYSNVIHDYVDPATAKPAHNYLPDLAAYLQTLGYPALSNADAWTTFKTLPTGLANIFADKVFVSELRAGQAQGYSIVNVLFPPVLGYTDNYGAPDPNNPKNSVSDPANANRFNADGTPKLLDTATGLLATIPVTRTTGDLDLLHSTIKTLQAATRPIQNSDGTSTNVAVGGDVTVLGPGGSINVGTTAQEFRDINRNPPRADIYNNLSNSSLGILTLNNGAINIFTDANVLVNQSRVLTVQGGDIVMWSSNGDLDAGRGAKTTVDFKPLSVNFDATNLQTINLNGLVSGAGIGTIQSTPDAPAASASLIAPRGTVNAGDAGLRSSGNLDILAFLVLNAANISAVGAVSGVPQVNSVNLGTLESASASGGSAAQVADAAVAAAASRGAQTVIRAIPALFSVEVMGFGDCDPDGGKRCSAQ